MSLSKCIDLADRVDGGDADMLLATLDRYTESGIAAKDAQLMAADDLIASLEARRSTVRRLVQEQHAELFSDGDPAARPREYFSDPTEWSRAAFSRREMVDYLASRNRGLQRVNGADVLEADIERAAAAVDLVREAIERGEESRTEVPIGPMPHVLHMLGAPMQMTQLTTSIVRKLLVDKHAADFAGVSSREFVEAIYKPAMVLRDKEPGRYKLMSTLPGPQGPIVFVVQPNLQPSGVASKTKVAAVMTAYSHKVVGAGETIEQMVAADRLLYVETDKAQAVINGWREQFREPPTAGLRAATVPQDAWSRLGPKVVAGVAAKKVRTDVDLMRFIGDNFDAEATGGWDNAPAFSRRTGQYNLRRFGIGAQIVEAIQDRYNRWKQSIEDVRKQGGTVTEINDFYATEERYWGKVGARIEDFGEEMQAFVQAVAKDHLMLDDVALYAYAQHAKERNEWIAQRRPGMPDGGSGMLTSEADLILAEAAASGLEARLAAHAATLRQWIQGTREILFNEGLIDQETYDNWSTMFQFYVPLRGLEGAPEARGTGQGFNIRGAEGKHALGRRSEARQLIEQIAQDRTRALIRSGKNEVLRSFGQFVMDNPSPNLWEVDAIETKAVETVDAHGNRIIDEQQSIIKDDRTVAFKDGGREVYIAVRDDRLREQLQNLHVENVGRFIGALLWTNRLLGRLYTSLNPVFTVMNGARDLAAATVGMIDEIGFLAAPKLWAQMPKALWESYRAEAGVRSADYQLYRSTGGKTGFFDFKTLDGQTAELQALIGNAERSIVDPRKLLPKVLAFIEAMNGGIENATRLASFKVARSSGRSVAEAARLAKNITVNFNRKGTMTPALSAWFLFFNPAVQGTTRIVQALGHPKVLATIATGMVGVAALALRNAAMGDDDDGVAWWDKIPDEVKERNLVIVLPPGAGAGESVPGSKIGRFVKIPMPYGYNFFAVVANQIVDAWRHSQEAKRGRDAKAAGLKAFSAFMGAWVPVQELGKSFETPQTALMAAVPDALNPIAQTLANSNAFGRKLYPDDRQSENAPDSAKLFPGQVGTLFHRGAEALNSATGGTHYRSGFLDVAPGSIEALVRGYGGGPAGFTLDVLNALYLRHSIARPELRVEALPFAKQLYGEIDAETDRLVGYDRLKEAEKKIEPFKRAQQEGARDDALAMRKEFGAILQLGDAVKSTREQLAAVRKHELATLAKEGVSDGMKYQLLMADAERRRKILQRFNALYDRAISRQDEAGRRPAQ